MKRYRIQRDPVIWLLFAVAVGVPATEFARLRADDVSRPAPEPPRVEQTRAPRVAPPAVPPPAPRAAEPAPRVEATPRVEPAPQLEPAPRADSAGVESADRARYAPIGPTTTPIVASVRSLKGDVAAVLEESGRVTLWNLDMHTRISRSQSTVPIPPGGFRTPPPMALVPPVDFGSVGPPAGTKAGAVVAVAGGDGRFHVWYGGDGSKLFTSPKGAVDPKREQTDDLHVVALGWTQGTIAISVASDGTAARWMTSQHPDSAFAGAPESPCGGLKAVDSSPDHGTAVIACAQGLYMAPTMWYQWTLVDSSARPAKVRLGPDGRLLASADADGTIRVYTVPLVQEWVVKGNAASLEHVTKPPRRVRTMQFAEKAAPWLLEFSPDGKLLAASGLGRTVYVWSMTPGTDPIVLTVPRGPVRTMWFAPHGRTLVVAGAGDRYFRGFEVPAGR